MKHKSTKNDENERAIGKKIVSHSDSRSSESIVRVQQTARGFCQTRCGVIRRRFRFNSPLSQLYILKPLLIE